MKRIQIGISNQRRSMRLAPSWSGSIRILKRLTIITAAVVSLMTVHQKARGAETYYIDNQRVLLYKIINWWYDCLPEASTQLCGSRLKYVNQGNALVHYVESEKELILGINGGFAELLSIINQCKGCYSPSGFKCTWLNRNYFGKGEAIVIGKGLPDQWKFAIRNVDKVHLQLIRTIARHIQFVVEGHIGGLMSGRIALHRGGDFLKTCPGNDLSEQEPLAINLALINARTKEVLATYVAIHGR